VQQPIVALRPPPAQGREVTLSRLLGAGGPPGVGLVAGSKLTCKQTTARVNNWDTPSVTTRSP
jgi:hypothetical protein